MKSRRWIAAAALAAAVVFLVMVTGEHGPAAPGAATPAPVSSSGAVLASDGGPPENDDADGGNGGGGGGEAADRDELINALQALLDALGVSADELADGAENSSCGNGGQDKSESGNGNDNNGNDNNSQNSNEKDKDNSDANGDANGACEPSEPASAGESSGATITIKGFAFGQPLTVAPGTTVEVVNTDAAPHNVTATDRSFKTANLNQDEKATFTAPTTPGRYEFTCTLHPEMTGTLIVEAGAGGQGGSRSSEPATGSQRGGGHDDSGQHQSTAPGRDNTSGGSSDGY